MDFAITCPIPGKTDITSMMLDAGAETDLVNSVGRTAAQMAAFVGKEVIALNFFHTVFSCKYPAFL